MRGLRFNSQGRPDLGVSRSAHVRAPAAVMSTSRSLVCALVLAMAMATTYVRPAAAQPQPSTAATTTAEDVELISLSMTTQPQSLPLGTEQLVCFTAHDHVGRLLQCQNNPFTATVHLLGRNGASLRVLQSPVSPMPFGSSMPACVGVAGLQGAEGARVAVTALQTVLTCKKCDDG